MFRENDNCFKIILKSALLLIAGIVAGFFALLLVYALPRGKMKEHVLENADSYTENYMLVDGYKSTLLDIHTDIVMLSAAICPASDNLIADMMFAPRRRLLENDDDSQLTANYTCEDESLVKYRRYPRYWHGYLVILKPLLMLFSVADLRLIYFFVQSILLLIIMAGLIKKNQVSFAVCFGLGILVINPMVTALNFQNASIYFILLLSLLFLICSGKLEGDYLIRKECMAFFQIIGMSVAYFDFFTYPVAALGVPLLFLLYFSDGKDVKKRIGYVMLHSVMFFAGYIGMYLGKWALATLLTDVNVFKDAYDEIMILLNAGKVEGEEITIISGMARNLVHFIQPPYLLLIAGGMIYAAAVSGKAKLTLIWARRSIPVLTVALYPFCHMLASAHSYYHYHFVYREFAVTVLAVLFMILDIKKSANIACVSCRQNENVLKSID